MYDGTVTQMIEAISPTAATGRHQVAGENQRRLPPQKH
jgi:hypothetical protein